MDIVNKYLEDNREVYDDLPVGIETMIKVRPVIKCKDGFEFSVQASATHYCTPRDNYGPYIKVEVGYPNKPEELLMEYIEVRGEAPCDSVYPWVPTDIVCQVIDKHGGMID